jgi:BirA family biotin operon repressor/biotin-[acetyl-CoA-carboxylase] ligase
VPANLVSATLRGGLFTRLVARRLLFFQELTSTMDEAARQAEAGTEEGTVVVAESQSAGRGRKGRSWVSQLGNLYVSVVFRPTLQTLPLVNILGGVATARAIRKVAGLEPRIKWPNDVLLNGKKVAGILVESVVTGDRVCYAVLGIGINVGLDSSSVEGLADRITSLSDAGRSVPREDLLRQLLQDLDTLYLQAVQGRSPLAEWRGLLETLGRRVKVDWRGEVYVGKAEDLDEIGNLRLRLDDGSLVTLATGDVSLQEA